MLFYTEKGVSCGRRIHIPTIESLRLGPSCARS